jgi:hypothetical protein
VAVRRFAENLKDNVTEGKLRVARGGYLGTLVHGSDQKVIPQIFETYLKLEEADRSKEETAAAK